MINLYDGQKVRIESGRLKQHNRFYRSIDGEVATISDYIDIDFVYVKFDNPIQIWNEDMGKHVSQSFAIVDAEVLKPVKRTSEGEFLRGEYEGLI